MIYDGRLPGRPRPIDAGRIMYHYCIDTVQIMKKRKKRNRENIALVLHYRFSTVNSRFSDCHRLIISQQSNLHVQTNTESVQCLSKK